jgi:TAG lipase/lysophosphatidylethanolamine acyltransferase
MLKYLWGWWWTKSRRDQLLDHIGEARIYEEWIAAARSLDECMDYDMWCGSTPSNTLLYHAR